MLEEMRLEAQREARAQRRRLVFLALVAHGPLQFAVGVALALGVAFVVLLFALAQCDFALD